MLGEPIEWTWDIIHPSRRVSGVEFLDLPRIQKSAVVVLKGNGCKRFKCYKFFTNLSPSDHHITRHHSLKFKLLVLKSDMCR